MKSLFLLLAFVPGIVIAQQVGDQVMPKMNAKVIKDEVEVVGYRLPLTIKKVEGENLFVHDGWIKSSEIVPLADAITYFTDYLKDNPGDATAHKRRGVVWNEMGESENAMNDYSEAIKLDPKHASAYNNRGGLLLNAGNYEDAIGDFTRAIELNPNNGINFYNRGYGWYLTDEYEKAIEDYSDAIRLVPTLSEAHAGRGDVRYSMADYDNAIKDYTEAIQLNPADANSMGYLCIIYAACPESKHRDGQRAVIIGIKACDLTEWRDPEYLHKLACAYAEDGDFGEAIKLIEKAIELVDENGHEVYLFNDCLRLFQERKPYREENSD